MGTTTNLQAEKVISTPATEQGAFEAALRALVEAYGWKEFDGCNCSDCCRWRNAKTALAQRGRV